MLYSIYEHLVIQGVTLYRSAIESILSHKRVRIPCTVAVRNVTGKTYTKLLKLMHVVKRNFLSVFWPNLYEDLKRGAKAPLTGVCMMLWFGTFKGSALQMSFGG